MRKFLVIFLLSTIIACGQTTNKSDNDSKKEIKTGEWKTLTQTDYLIQYPDKWELNQSGQMGTKFILFSPFDTPQDKFRKNINLIVQDLTGQSIDLNKFVEISENQIKTMVTNSKLIESKRIKTETGEYQKVIFSGDQGVFHLKFEQYYFVADNKAYILTLTTEIDKFDSAKELGEKILNTFKIKK